MQGFYFSIKGNSIVQLKIKTVKQNGNTKSTSHQIKKTKLATVGSTLPVILNMMTEEGACLSVNATADAHKKKPTVLLSPFLIKRKFN